MRGRKPFDRVIQRRSEEAPGLVVFVGVDAVQVREGGQYHYAVECALKKHDILNAAQFLKLLIVKKRNWFDVACAYRFRFLQHPARYPERSEKFATATTMRFGEVDPKPTQQNSSSFLHTAIEPIAPDSVMPLSNSESDDP